MMNCSRAIVVTIAGFFSVFFAVTAFAQADGAPDTVSGASPAAPEIDSSKELPVRLVPDIPPAAEGY